MKQKPKSESINPGHAFTGLVARLNNEVNVRLSRATLAIVLNLSGLTAVALRSVTSSNEQEKFLYAAFCFFAILLDLIWNLAIKRNTVWIEFYLEKLIELEQRCGFAGGLHFYDTDRFRELHADKEGFTRGWKMYQNCVIIIWAVLGTVMAISVLT